MKSPGEGYIDKSALGPLQGTTLFYPCSGNDLPEPIQFFSPYVTEFWFVDRGYFAPRHQDTRNYGLDKPASRHRPLLNHDDEYVHISTQVIGPDYGSERDTDIEPIILRETYDHYSGQTITVNKRRGYGFSALRTEITSLGVFFYRGDSAGEGGSGNWWLADAGHVREVLAKLIDNGLMVLDGSDGSQHYRRADSHEYASFWKYRKVRLSSPQDALQVCAPFTDSLGNRFTCVGYAGQCYGNTFIWQVKKKERAW
jgi:hypothetical protein